MSNAPRAAAIAVAISSLGTHSPFAALHKFGSYRGFI